MKKAEFIALVADKAGISKKDADTAVDAVFAAIEDVLASGDKLALPGFGTFEVRERSARMGHNIQTGEAIEIPAAKVPAFRPNAQLKERVNG